MASPRFEIYQDTMGTYRWRLIDSKGQSVASSGEGFTSKANAKRAAKNVKGAAAKAEIEA